MDDKVKRPTFSWKCLTKECQEGSEEGQVSETPGDWMGYLCGRYHQELDINRGGEEDRS